MPPTHKHRARTPCLAWRRSPERKKPDPPTPLRKSCRQTQLRWCKKYGVDLGTTPPPTRTHPSILACLRIWLGPKPWPLPTAARFTHASKNIVCASSNEWDRALSPRSPTTRHHRALAACPRVCRVPAAAPKAPADGAQPRFVAVCLSKQTRYDTWRFLTTSTCGTLKVGSSAATAAPPSHVNALSFARCLATKNAINWGPGWRGTQATATRFLTSQCARRVTLSSRCARRIPLPSQSRANVCHLNSPHRSPGQPPPRGVRSHPHPWLSLRSSWRGCRRPWTARCGCGT